jgi:sugar lactone lactonase YvrE
MPPPPDRGAVGRILLVRPDGNARVVAEGLRFPNGIAVSADHKRLVVAEMDGGCLADYDIEADGALRFRGRLGRMNDPDGICLDRDGAVWVASFTEDAFIRIDRNGEELQRIAVPGRRALACALGGPDRKTLFCLSAATSYEELKQRKSSSRIDVVAVETEGSGFP